MQFTAELQTVHLKETFRTSKGEADSKVVCVVKFGDALGECCPSLHYGYSAEDCCDVINSSSFELPTDPFQLSVALDTVKTEAGGRYSLLAGLDIALHDHVSRSANRSLWNYLALPNPVGRESSYTISVDAPGMIEKRLKNAEDFRILKLKLGGEYDQENLELLGRQRGRTVRVDANGALDLNNMEWLIKAAHDLKLELIEEPLADTRPASLAELQKELKCPIIMDESIKDINDVEKYAGSIGGINIKLQKVGGIRNALAMIAAAQATKMRIMIGCMLETSIGISASANLAGLADYLDLDSSYLLRDEPFEGVFLKDSRLVFPDRPGHGAMERDR